MGINNDESAGNPKNYVSNLKNKAVAMKGLTLSLLHLHFGFGWKFYDRAKILGSGEKFMFRRKFWVWEEILSSG